MGRGGSGGGHASGGSHSHGSGSHGSSHSHSRGRGSSFHSSSSRGSYHRESQYHSHRYYGGRRYYGGGGFGPIRFSGPVSSRAVLIRSLTTFFLVLLILVALFFGSGNKADIAPSTIPRTPVESGNAYISDCIVDEIGWIDNEASLSRDLKTFYKKTGCQPYLILKAYDPAYTNTAACEEWSRDYYDTHFKENQNVVLYTYFCDQYDEGYGNDTLFLGTQSGLVFDGEAQEIFWDELDYYWSTWDPDDNDGMFVKVFTETADRIMTVTTTGMDVAKTALIVVGVVAVGIFLLIFVIRKYRREKEKAQETIDILNAPIDEFGDAADDLADKYTSGTKEDT